MQSKKLIANAESLADMVRADAEATETNRRLSQSIARSMAELGLYRIAAPLEIGGQDADTSTQMRVVETVSQAGGAAGWNLMIGMEIFGLVAPSMGTCLDLIKSPFSIMAGSTASVGNAEIAEAGYRVSGQWQFVSGIHNADVFGATVRLTQSGEPQSDTLYYAMIPRGEYEIVDTWRVSGLCGSGSHDVRLDNVPVPANRIVPTLGKGSMKSQQLQIPLGVRLTFNKVAVALGIARSGIDAFCALAHGKTPRFSSRKLTERHIAHMAVAKAEARLRSARAGIYEHAQHVWDTCQQYSQLSNKDRALAHALACDAVKAAIESVDWVTEAAGTSSNFLDSPLNRIGRDIRVVQQHTTVSPHHMADAGRVLLGLEPRGILTM